MKPNAPRICFVSSTYPGWTPGGAEVQMIRLARRFLAMGWSVDFTSETWPEDQPRPTTLEGIRIHPIQRSFRFQPLSVFGAAKALERIGADIYYQRGMNVYSAACANACRRLGAPMIWAASMNTLLQPNPFLDAEGKWRAASPPQRAFRKLRADLEWRQMRSAIVRADLRLAQNRAQQEHLKTNLGVDSILLPNGAEAPMEAARKTERFTVCWAANMKPIKRPEKLLEIIEAVRAENPTIEFEVVGRTDGSKIAQRLESIEGVTVNGQLSPSETDEKIGQAQILLNTSESEGYPNTFIQAWFRRTAVFSLKADPDGLLGAQGLGHSFGDRVDATSQAILEAAQQPQSLEMMLERAKKFAAEQHDIEEIASKLDRLIGERFGIRP